MACIFGLILASGCSPSYDGGDGLPVTTGATTSGSTTTTTGEGASGGDILPTGGQGGSGVTCNGSCVQTHSSPYLGPTMMWIGPFDKAPPCPEVAPLPGFEGFSDLIPDPFQCPSCSCSPAGCALPESIHASAGKCPGDGSEQVPWDAAPGWEGVCSADGAIAAGASCGGSPCQSVTLAAPVIEPCKPVATGPLVAPTSHWGTRARECLVTLSDTCPVEGELCAPDPPDGFALCIYRDGDEPKLACPESYPLRHVVYSWADDGRACSDCHCGDPEGGSCAALVSVFSDGLCSKLVGSYLLTSDMDKACHDVPPGVALGSKDAMWTMDKPAACAPSGGEAAGDIHGGGPMTYCCKPAAPPTP